jgi:hypothetical protein
MSFTGYSGEVTTMLFAISDNVVPNWFGVAVPHGLSDFTRPHIFFHPTPGQAGYVDSDYPTKSGKWPELFYYMERLGYQMDGAHRNQVLIMPFMTEGAENAGILPANWQDIVQQILTLTRAAINPADTSALSVAQLVVSSFSAGMIYSDSFRRTGAGVADVLAEVWDFDGVASSFSAMSIALHSTATVEAIKYDQGSATDTNAYHVPASRWQQLPNPPKTFDDVHALIRDFMFLDAASVSQVGSLIDEGPAPTTGTHTATHAISATHSGTLSGSLTHTASLSHSQSGSGTQTAAHTGTATHSGTATGSGTAAHATTAVHTGTAGTHTATHAGSMANGVPPAAPMPAMPSAPLAPFAPAPPAAVQLPPGPQAPAQVQAPVPAQPPSNPQACSCSCTPAIVAACAVNAQTAITAITAIARQRPR